MNRTHCDLLITNGTIISADDANTIIQSGCIAITDKRITHIGPSRDADLFESPQTLSATNCIVMPGLVNTHCHTPMSLFRGMADDLPLMTWLNEYMFKAEAKYINPENTRIGALVSCAEMLLSGTTLVCDGYFHEDTVAKVFNEIGLKGVLGQGVIDFPAPGVLDPTTNIQYAIDFVQSQKNKHPGITPSIFCHSPYTCSQKTLIEAKEAAHNNDVLFQIHISETSDEHKRSLNKHGVSPIQYLNNIGLLDKNTLLVHCVWVDENDIAIIKQSGAAISHCPESNMKLASGIAPLNKFLSAEIPTGLGTDGCASNNNLDMFSEMDTGAKLQKVSTLDPEVADAVSMLKMATINGARAIGKDDETGSLEIGKKADIILLDTEKPHLYPMYNPVSHIVYTASGSDVRDVLIDGKVIVENRKLTTVDLNSTMNSIKAFAEKMRL